MGTTEGAALLGIDAGDIALGHAADLVAVDLAHPSLHPPTRLLKSVVYAMSPQAVTDVSCMAGGWSGPSGSPRSIRRR